MKVSELNALIENIVTTEVKKIISEQSEGKKEVYHIMCDGEPVSTFDSEKEAKQHLQILEKDHPEKEFLIEKAAYESHDDMLNKLDEMGEQLENETENMENKQMDEKLYGNQSKLDKNHNGKLDASDFKSLRGGEEEECDECGNSYMEEEEECDECGDGYMEEEGKMYGAFHGGDDKINSDWFDEEGKKYTGDFDFDHDEESFDDYDSFNSKYGGKHKWFSPGDEGKMFFDKYKEYEGGHPFKVRTRRNSEEMSEEACPKCGKELCECGMGLYESADRKKKKKLRLKESELINLIKGMVSESLNGEPGTAGTPGMTFTKKAQQGSKKENQKALADVDKKMKDYLNFDGNDNSEFPHQNGVATKKAAFNNTKEQDEEVAKNFAGLQNLDYDIEPSQQFKDRLKKAIEGHTTMGNAPTTEKASIKPSNGSEKGKEAKEKEGNHIQTPETAKKMNKQVKDRQKDKDARVLYNKETVPVNESQVKFKNILAEEINKMKSLSSYNKKTQ
jgi:hypothetical protein